MAGAAAGLRGSRERAEGRAVSEGSETENRGKQLVAVCGEKERGAEDFELWGGLRG